MHHHHDHFGNPTDLKAYLRRLTGKKRDRIQQPDRVIKTLKLKRGARIAEIGAGPGYFTLRLSRAVGKDGRVWACDVEPRMLAILRDQLKKQRVTNVTPVLSLADDPLLAPKSADLVLVVNTYHHVHDRIRYLQKLKKVLHPNGRLVNIDFAPGELPIGPPAAEKISQQQFVSEAERAGWRLESEHTFLEYQYFLVLSSC